MQVNDLYRHKDSKTISYKLISFDDRKVVLYKLIPQGKKLSDNTIEISMKEFIANYTADNEGDIILAIQKSKQLPKQKPSPIIDHRFNKFKEKNG